MHTSTFITTAFFLFLPLINKTSAFAISNHKSKLTLEDLRTCHFAKQSCKACWSECPAAHLQFFGSVEHPTAHEHLAVSLEQCLRDSTFYRQWLPDWCANDKHGFYATPNFRATEENCLMQPYVCSQRIEKIAREELRQKKVGPKSGRFKFSLKLGQLGRAQKHLNTLVDAFGERKKRVEAITKAWKERWLEEAEIHINNPEENVTKYSDPVFQNYQDILKENQQLNVEISSNDLVSATIENKFVRKNTFDKIPSYLTSIQKLKNHIHSKQNETERYLAEIKQIAVRTAALQENTTNIIYETTHSRQLEGEIDLLDNQLLDLYIELKKERTKLRELNIRATFAKLRLVGIMRMTIHRITRQQIQKGCSSSQLVGF